MKTVCGLCLTVCIWCLRSTTMADGNKNFRDVYNTKYYVLLFCIIKIHLFVLTNSNKSFSLSSITCAHSRMHLFCSPGSLKRRTAPLKVFLKFSLILFDSHIQFFWLSVLNFHACLLNFFSRKQVFLPWHTRIYAFSSNTGSTAANSYTVFLQQRKMYVCSQNHIESRRIIYWWKLTMATWGWDVYISFNFILYRYECFIRNFEWWVAHGNG